MKQNWRSKMANITVDDFPLEVIEKLEKAGFTKEKITNSKEEYYVVTIPIGVIKIILSSKVDKSANKFKNNGYICDCSNIEIYGIDDKIIDKLEEAGFEGKLYYDDEDDIGHYIVTIESYDVSIYLHY